MKKAKSKTNGYLIAKAIIRSYDQQDREEQRFRGRIRVITRRFAGKIITLEQIEEFCSGYTVAWRDSLIAHLVGVKIFTPVPKKQGVWMVSKAERARQSGAVEEGDSA